MATKITFTCAKGGVGKSTTTSSVAGCIRKISEKNRVLIIDLDEQNNMRALLGVRNAEPDAYIANVLSRGLSPVEVAVKNRDGIDVIPSGGRFIKDWERDISVTGADKTAHEILKRRMADFEDNWDYILIDTPPAIGALTANALVYSDYCIIPSTMDFLGTAGIKSTAMFIEELGKLHDGKIAKLLGVLPVQFDRRRRVDNDVLDDLDRMIESTHLNLNHAFDAVRMDSRMKTSQINRRLIIDKFPKANASEDYMHFTMDLLKLAGAIKQGKRGKPTRSLSTTQEALLDV